MFLNLILVGYNTCLILVITIPYIHNLITIPYIHNLFLLLLQSIFGSHQCDHSVQHETMEYIDSVSKYTYRNLGNFHVKNIHVINFQLD